jgi:saccharopine dehydrogenase-like NADP-dependent oxidoreductase
MLLTRGHAAIEVVSFDSQDELDALVKRTRVCISLVLYLKVGTMVVKSCVENGTDYIDWSVSCHDLPASY